MSEQLDNELKKRISEVFEHYEDTVPAQEGWKLLRQKFPEKSKRRVLPVWWSAAALFLLFCAFGLWLYNQPQTKQTVVKQQPEIKPAGNSDALKSSPQGPANPLHPNVTGVTQQPPLPGNAYADNARKPDRSQSVTLSPQVSSTTRQLNAAAAAQQPLSPLNGNVNDNSTQTETQQQAMVSTPAVSLPAITQQRPAQSLPNPVVSSAITKMPVYAQGGVGSGNKVIIADQGKLVVQAPVTKQNGGTVSKKDTTIGTKQSRMTEFLVKEQNKEAANNIAKRESKLPVDKKVLYNVYAATYFNYANGSSSQVNTGAGFGTDIKLSSHFKLSTGVAIGKNTLSYNSQPTQANIQRDAVSAGNAAAFNSSANVQAGFSSVPLQVNADAVVAGYNVSLTGLDVPVNIKYEFSPKKSDSYISAGLSSGTFINESYNYRYVSSVNALGATNSLPDANSRKSFTSFDFARTLNLSLGMGYQITKSNRLIIEPFVKYPLSGLGSQEIRFGSSGINLRLKFQTKK